jgi:hypothetical protein
MTSGLPIRTSCPDHRPRQIDRWGGYSRVPVEAWQRFDADMKAWQQAYRRRHEGEEIE